MAVLRQIILGVLHFCIYILPTQQNRTEIKVGVLLMTEHPAPFDLRRVGPALDIGVEKAMNETGINITFVVKNYSGFCPLQTTMGNFAELVYTDKVSAVIGPACSHTMEAPGRLAAYLGIPIVTGVGDLVLRKPGDMYESLTILSYNIAKLSVSVSTVLRHYEWSHTAVIYDETDYFMNVAGENLVHDLKISHNFSRPYDFPFDPAYTTDFGSILIRATRHARVFIILCNAELFRDILYRGYQLGMANGDFVFITLELFPTESLGYYMKFIRNDTKDAGVTQAYESVLILTIRKLNDPHFKDFANEVKHRAFTNYNYTFGPTEEVNYFITAFHDSVLYLANAYKAVVDAGEDVTNGTNLAQKLWGKTFNGVLGGVKVDEVGDRVADFDLFDMGDPAVKQFQAVGHFRGSTMQYTPITGINIVWRNGKPLDKPVCGFSHELCITTPEDQTMMFVIVAVVLVLVIAVGSTCGIIFYRKYKLESELGKKEWLIKFDEVQHRKGKANDSFMSRASLSIEDKDDHEQVFTQTAYCRNTVVAIRKLYLKNTSLTRGLALEFNQMYRLNHSNLSKFIGAYIEPNHVCLLMEYGPRGSLQDLIHNESIELDYPFRYSLIGDIIKGMCALHSSSVKVHGRLSSSNCVIDSRFALKITDFGPKSLLLKDRMEEMEKAEKYHMFFNKRKLFWTAPEHLRQLYGKGVPYSQKGDVFSFAIILQEICTRSEPYEGNHLDVEEVITSLIKGGSRPLRPDINEENFESPELLSLMMSCWAENPLERPSFSEIDGTFKQLRNKSGVTTNIVDNLLQRMSNYADNLETLAAERTKSYLEEKQKVEELLHRLLPDVIAQQLQTGKQVLPEYFECVSVYFSDIVGFSSIAARSTPLETVDLLNDMYTAFDTTMERFNVYKVETTGDAYMCVSGLPIVVENVHVKDICNMALAIRQTAKTFKIKHMPKESLRVRIGIHSGPVVAGVVGLTMPKYCLFGETVHIASLMESNSEAMKIKLSEDTKKVLDKFPQFKVGKGESIDVKDKGKMGTYWLLEKETEEEDFLNCADSSIDNFLKKSKLKPINIGSFFSTTSTLASKTSIASKRSLLSTRSSHLH